MRQPLMFKLDQAPNNRGLRCDRGGLFLGRKALLQQDNDGSFHARPADDLRRVFGSVYGDEADWDSRIRSVNLVANALNKGDIARAMMTAVLMRLPEPDGYVGFGDANYALAKAGFNPDEPRDARGRWTNGDDSRNDEADTVDHAPGAQLADVGLSDASDDATTQAAARAAAAERRNPKSGGFRGKPIRSANEGGVNNWITQSRKLWAAIVAFFGNPQNTTRTAEDTHALASRILGSHLSKLPGVRSVYYHTKLSTITNGEIPSGKLPDVTVVMEDNTVQPYEILSPGQRAFEANRKYAGARPIAGSKFRLADVQIMSKEEVMALPEAAPIAAEEEAEAQAAIAAQAEEEVEITFGAP